jgi:hypothetical protein
MREKGWIMSVKLSDAQLVILSAAAQREDLCLSAPDTMKGAILTKVSQKLVKLGLVREIRAKTGMPVWRRDAGAESYALKLVAAGLKAITVDGGPEGAIAPREAPQQQRQPDPNANKASGPDLVSERARTLMPRVGSKLARVIHLLQRSEGVTIPNLIGATGWLPHTTRATLTGLRKRGYAIARERIDGGDSAYRIVGPAVDGGDRSFVQAEASEGRDRELSRRRSIRRRDRHGLQAS